MNAKEKLRRRIEGLTEEEAADLLDYWSLLADPDTLTVQEAAAAREEAGIARGDYVTLEQLRRELGR